MAIYKRLSLAAGGGIVSVKQQADQMQNSANLLIGIGGTGIDCLCTIKKQVYKRLVPDDPNALKATYQHIQFLGVDSDKKSKELLQADEYFPISHQGSLKTLFAHKEAIDAEPAYDFLRNDKVAAADLTEAGAGGIRQAGRFLLLRKYDALFQTVASKLQNAAHGLVGNVSTNVHIFTGVGGGTGSGCFLEVCYLVKDVLNVQGINATVFGYVFMPDVNLSKGLDAATNEYIKTNGYAALQEIDYCMNLQFNEGGFRQRYSTTKAVDWKADPVDMCHLIGASNGQGGVIPNAYEYAMHVVSEYVLDYLTHTPDTRFTLQSALGNFTARVGVVQGKLIRGNVVRYCAIGAACATLPMTEINTYLASELYGKFANLYANAIPTNNDVDNLALRIFAPGSQNRSEIYERFIGSISEGSPSQGFTAYDGTYKEVLVGNKAFIQWYVDQLGQKKGKLEENAKKLMGENQNSLMTRFHEQMKHVICGFGNAIPMGPGFALGMIDSASDCNLLNIIAGLLKENEEQLNHMLSNFKFVDELYKSAEKDFKERRKRDLGFLVFDNDNRRFADYENALHNLCVLELDIEKYRQAKAVLTYLQTEIQKSVGSFYRVLARVMTNLQETFAENVGALNLFDQNMAKQSEFYIPMMTIQELTPSMNAEIQKINIPNMLNLFLNHFYQEQNKWIEEDENKISSMVIDFFVNQAFSGFADKSITSFLQDKYQTTNSEQLVQYIHRDYIGKLNEKAAPLFPLDHGIIANPPSQSHFSVPSQAAEVMQAAQEFANANTTEYNPIDVNGGNLTDRIYMLKNIIGFPMGASIPLASYENEYFAKIENIHGSHYYEGERKGKEGRLSHMPFSNWKELSPIRPSSYITIDHTTAKEKVRILKTAKDIYEKGMQLGVIGALASDSKDTTDDNIYTIDEAVLTQISDTMSKLKVLLEKKKLSVTDLSQAEAFCKDLEKLVNTELTPTGTTLHRIGSGALEDQARIRKDFFIASPAKHALVKAGIEKLSRLQEERERLKEYKNAVDKERERLLKESRQDFYKALFVGAFEYQGLNLKYIQEECYFRNEYELSAMDPKFQYHDIPLYQAYLSYFALDDEIKDSIKNLYFDKMKAINAELKDYAEELRKKVQNQVNNWMAIAKGMDNGAAIQRFLKDLNQELVNHINTISQI